MAEILILKRDHWASTKPDKWTQEKFDMRQRIGDVVEVRPNGFFRIEALGTGAHGWDREAFAVIRVPSVSESVLSQYKGGLMDGDVTVRKFRAHMPDLASFAWTKATVTIGGKEISEWYADVNNAQQTTITVKTV